MSKKYFILSYGSIRNQVLGVCANPTLAKATNASDEEVKELVKIIEGSATSTLLDCLRDGTYPNPVQVWYRRADARAVCKDLNSFNGAFNFRVLEVGEKTARKLREIAGWQIWYGPVLSSFNSPEDGALLYLKGYGSAFHTRAQARKALPEINTGYKIIPVYANA